MSDVQEFLLIRHPETVANATGRHVSRGDSPYSVRGSAQFERLPELVRAWNPDAIVSSPQRRALAPARLAAVGLELRVDADLAEFDVGRVEGLSHEEGLSEGLIDERAWYDVDAVPFAGGERIGDFRARCILAWDRLVAEAVRRVAVFAHRGVIMTITADALGLPPEAMWRLRVEPAQGVLLRMERGYTSLASLGTLPTACDDGTMHSDP